MKNLTIALLQIDHCGVDQAANLQKGEENCRRARSMGADIALFPEMWSVGYSILDPKQPGSREAMEANATTVDGPFVTHFRELAKELEMAIAVTFMEAWTGGPRNSVSLIDRHGNIVLTYAKVHTCSWDPEEGLITPGDDFYVGELDTAAGPLKVGAMICYDREFPESARILMLKGAELILVPNACDLEINRLTQMRARAYENMVALAMANYPGPENYGHSIAFDGIAFDEKSVSRDMRLVEAGEGEGIFLAYLDLDALRDYRRRENWGNTYRRPSVYGPIVSPEVQPPFVRPDTRR